jgi:site-specific recombinase XerC
MDVVEIAATQASQIPQDQESRLDLNEVVRSLLNTLSDDERKNLAKEILGQQRIRGPVSLVEESELLKDFITDSRNRGLAENSLVSYRSVLKRFGNYQKRYDRYVAEIDSSVLEGFLSELRELGFRYNTLSNYYSVLSSFCEYLVFRGLKDINPVPAFEKRYLRSYSH